LIRKERGRRKTNDIHEPFCSVHKLMRGNSDDKNHTYAHKHMAGRDGTWVIIASRQTFAVSARSKELLSWPRRLSQGEG
jgi:hypothetical protein